MSYASQQFLICDNSTDANYRSWGSAVSAAIAAMGWTQSGDTGQINWTTVTSPASGSFNYEIWTPADGGTAFYLKVEYGSSSGSPKGVRMRMSIGTTTNGSGTLTGLLTAVLEPSITTAIGRGSVGYECNFSGDTDRLSMMLWRNLAAAPIQLFSVERTKNTDGTNNTEGVTILCGAGGGATTSQGHQTLVFGVAVGNQYNNAGNGQSWVCISDFVSAGTAFNNNIACSPCFPLYGKFGNPMTTICFVKSTEVAEGCEFTTTLYGSTRTYLATNGIGITNPTGTRICMRFD